MHSCRRNNEFCDFENLAALYSKRYAPYDWKRAAFGFDLLNIKPWVDRIRTAKSDLEFFEIEAEYVGRLQDTHSGFQMSSTFRASLGMSVDIYDGKVLIDSINRTQLPAASYPFQVGDELVSVDGVSSEDWIKRLSTWRQYGNPVTTRRIAAQQITLHVQATFPRAAEIGETAIVEIRRASGALEGYTIRWAKSGVPFTVVGPTPMPQLFSISAADIFPSMIQDNKRAILVGMRSSGGGGSVSGWPTGFYSESISTNTNTLVVRKKPIVTPNLPAAPYVENIGARPEIALDFMTRDNLLTGGRAYVDRFTQIVGDEIQKALTQNPYTIPPNGGISLSTPGGSGEPVIGYGRIEPNGSSNAPNGLAIFGLRQNNVLVTEATVSATPAIQTGRIYAEIDGSVDTGVAIANPNNAPSTISFYFTSAAGNTNSGSTTIPANSQVAAFLDQAPFNGPTTLAGTFTFTASAPVAVTALHGFNNERGEFLITTLQVVNLALPPTTGAIVFPHYADRRRLDDPNRSSQPHRHADFRCRAVSGSARRRHIYRGLLDSGAMVSDHQDSRIVGDHANRFRPRAPQFHESFARRRCDLFFSERWNHGH
jgi:PDZ domain/Peptidase family S41